MCWQVASYIVGMLFIGSGLMYRTLLHAISYIAVYFHICSYSYLDSYMNFIVHAENKVMSYK